MLINTIHMARTGRNNVMKTIMRLTAAAAVLLGAGVAVAQEDVEITGNSPGRCVLPETWTFVSANGGASAAGFGGTTWTIPPAALADGMATPATGPEYAIRIRGLGFCNISHRIQLSSLKGGLVGGTPGAPPPGFANRRAMSYEAQWSTAPLGDSGRGAFGPQVSFTPAAAGAVSAPALYTVSNTLAPPGSRAFDLRMGLQRDPLAGPLVAGAYSDQLTVTLSANP